MLNGMILDKVENAFELIECGILWKRQLII